MAIYPLEIDGIKGYTNTLKTDKLTKAEENLLKKLGPAVQEAARKEREEKAKQGQPKSVEETLELLESMSSLAKALGALDLATRKAREELAMNLIVSGEDPQKVADACAIPMVSTYLGWAAKRSDVTPAMREALGKVNTRQASGVSEEEAA